MLSRSLFLAYSGAAAASSAIPAATLDATQGDEIFRRAKAVWLLRRDAPFITYGFRERYVWRDRPHENWWQASYRSSDGELVLQRIVVPQEEAQRLKGVAIGLHLHFHAHKASVDSLDTNPDADAFPVLDPLIEPSAAFGMVHQRLVAELVASQTDAPPSDAAVAIATPSPTASPDDEATPLREISHVEVFARDYQIILVGIEHLPYGAAYHLSLAPLHDPQIYRLRDLWVATDSYATLQLAVDGLFEGKPYEDARWIVSYVPLGGSYYIQQIRTDDVLRFGLDRMVSGFAFDFVDYAFPSTLPDYLFTKLL
ncbi:MAG TPA: hypothetical protein VME66_02565 [Candidatus Acidoferrales bacterium]|nr:hypothetical protein [Candidatus Acidoferrales bacterium]